MKLREGNVVCVCQSVDGVPCGHYPWCIGPHCTGTPPPGGNDWRPVQTCSLQDPRMLISGGYCSNVWSAQQAMHLQVCFLVTAHKRSLRRLCFYTCLSVILFTGGTCPGTLGRYTPRGRYTPPGQ